MDNVQNWDSYINIPSPQAYRLQLENIIISNFVCCKVAGFERQHIHLLVLYSKWHVSVIVTQETEYRTQFRDNEGVMRNSYCTD
jgi:hypothetical protein